MRISVHLCQRKFLNKHLRFSIHDLHVFVHPPLVSKSYAPCFCHVRTFPVSLVCNDGILKKVLQLQAFLKIKKGESREKV
jgi:hypothetical protein